MARVKMSIPYLIGDDIKKVMDHMAQYNDLNVRGSSKASFASGLMDIFKVSNRTLFSRLCARWLQNAVEIFQIRKCS